MEKKLQLRPDGSITITYKGQHPAIALSSPPTAWTHRRRLNSSLGHFPQAQHPRSRPYMAPTGRAVKIIEQRQVINRCRRPGYTQVTAGGFPVWPFCL